VTHDQEEALEMADRIAVMNEGRLQQIGTPEDIYDRPANRFVAEFVGTLPINIIEMSSLDNTTYQSWLNAGIEMLGLGDQQVHSLGIRPETIDILPSTASANHGSPLCSAQIIDLVPTGGNWIVELDVAGSRLFALKAQVRDLKPDQLVQLSVSKQDLHAFDAAGDRLVQTPSK